MKECTTHHHACDCREDKFKKLQAENKDLKAMWKSLYKSDDKQTWIDEMQATVDSYMEGE